MKHKLRRLSDFLSTDIWRIRQRALPPSQSLLIHHLRAILLAVRGFSSDKCTLRASALTFYSILSIVPVVAMAFGVAKGFGLEDLLDRHLRAALHGQAEMAERIISFSQNLLANAKGGVVAGVGVAILLWTIIKVLGNIEKSFNDIWGIKKGRSFSRRFADYVSIMLICPILLATGSTVTIVLKARIDWVFEAVAFLGFLGPLVYGLLKLFPVIVGCGVLAFVYVFMPNTKVSIRSGLLAGIVAGVMFQIVQWAYITFQIGVSRTNAVYGSFAALPLFLMWLQVSWLVVLFGAELSFAHQNVETYEFEPDCLGVSLWFKRLLALKITHLLVKDFAVGAKPRNAAAIAHTLGVPIRLVNDVLYELANAGILSVTAGEDERERGYQPARTLDSLSIAFVLDALNQRGSDNIPLAETEATTTLTKALQTFAEAAHRAPANVLLKDIPQDPAGEIGT